MSAHPTLFNPSVGLERASEHWCLARDGDRHCLDMYRRHYSKRNYLEERQPLFVGPGRKLVLLSTDGKALWAWRKFIDDTKPRQTGYNCSIFRNEGSVLSSTLVREAVGIVFDRWGRDRCYTLVSPGRIRSSNPGCCFKKAGWRKCGVSRKGLTILEYVP